MDNIITISVPEFGPYIAQHPVYRSCSVVGMTHAKNANSPVLHEYLHIILRDRSGRWLRILVERQANQDQVIIGLWPWVSPGRSLGSSRVGSSSWKDKKPAPLLMRYVPFEPPVSLDYLVQVLLAVHRRRPKYHLLTANCFWYANAVFEVLRGKNKAQHFVWYIFKGIFAVSVVKVGVL